VPEIAPYLKAILFSPTLGKLLGNPFPTLIAKVQHVIQCRKANQDMLPAGQTDLIQLMLDAELSDEMETSGLNEFNMTTMNKADKKLTADEIVGQILAFLFGGTGTTAHTLTYCTYLLAVNPEKQDLLREEILTHFPDTEASITYEALLKLPYLDMVIKETLRLFPIASFAIARKATANCELKGIQIPKGIHIVADVWSIHKDPEIWGNDAETFQPDRFASQSDRHPLSWIPFGVGPRFCIGMRFAIMEIKLALCKMLQKITFQQCAATQVPLKFKQAGSIMFPENGVYVKVVPNHNAVSSSK